MKATRKIKDYALKHAKVHKDKKVKGFTLVELIIVIAIIGILAAILIPTMTGKVKDAKLKTANDAAAKIAEQAAIYISEQEAQGNAVVANGKTYAAAEAMPTTLSDAIKKVMPSLDSSAVWGISISSDGAVDAVVYAKSNSDSFIGMYPKAATDKEGPIGKDDIDTMLTKAKGGTAAAAGDES